MPLSRTIYQARRIFALIGLRTSLYFHIYTTTEYNTLIMSLEEYAKKRFLIVDELDSFRFSTKKTLMREMALLKIISSKTQLEKANKLCKKYKHTLLDRTDKSFVLEVSALKKEIDKLIKNLQPLGLASVSRTGVVAMTK